MSNSKAGSTRSRGGALLSASPPDHMSEVAQQAWRGIVPVLADTRILRDIDLLAVEMLSEAYADYNTADQELRNNWIIQTRSDGTEIPIQSRYTYKIDGFGNRVASLHPAYAAKREASTAIRHWLNELGMTPAARARILGSVHNLPSADSGDSDSSLPAGDLVLDDLSTTDRNAMREILQRRLTGGIEAERAIDQADVVVQDEETSV